MGTSTYQGLVRFSRSPVEKVFAIYPIPFQTISKCRGKKKRKSENGAVRTMGMRKYLLWSTGLLEAKRQMLLGPDVSFPSRSRRFLMHWDLEDLYWATWSCMAFQTIIQGKLKRSACRFHLNPFWAIVCSDASLLVTLSRNSNKGLHKAFSSLVFMDATAELQKARD